MSNQKQALDHGYVRLLDHMGNDLSIVRAARVSYDAAHRAGEDEGSDYRLIHYLWRNKHSTPFEAVTFTFEVMAPIFVFRQWHRHRTWSYNELSARYRELPERFYVPRPEQVGMASKTNKQAREFTNTPLNVEQHIEDYKHTCVAAFKQYADLLASGWPRELARMVLPVSTYSHMFGTVNLLNLFKFIDLRANPHAQWEIRQYAEAMLELIEPVVPICVHAFKAGVV